jgi:hypothetical protein
MKQVQALTKMSKKKNLTEGEGVEPSVSCLTLAFKANTINHSDNLPRNYYTNFVKTGTRIANVKQRFPRTEVTGP